MIVYIDSGWVNNHVEAKLASLSILLVLGESPA